MCNSKQIGDGERGRSKQVERLSFTVLFLGVSIVQSLVRPLTSLNCLQEYLSHIRILSRRTIRSMRMKITMMKKKGNLKRKKKRKKTITM